MIPFTWEIVLNVFALCVIAAGIGYFAGWVKGAKIKEMNDKEIADLNQVRRYRETLCGK